MISTPGQVSSSAWKLKSSQVPRISSRDLDHVLNHTREHWAELRGGRIFISGGTGFFGCWLLETFAHINDLLNLGATAVVLTRNPSTFALKAPHLASHPAIQTHTGDIRTFDFPAGEFDFVIHAATDAVVASAPASQLETVNTIIDGTRRILEFAGASGARGFLFASSGAVYGRQPPELTHVPESYCGSPDPTDTASAYGEAKRLAETLCCLQSLKYGFTARIARCFAFSGPWLPLDRHFALGNFMSDALLGNAIRIEGDGTPIRSYLYASDLAIWLWTILFRGRQGTAYNVGSEIETSIAELASAVVRQIDPALTISVAKSAVPGSLPLRYVPSTGRARTDLGLRQHVTMEDSVARMAEWYGALRPDAGASPQNNP